MAVAFHLHYLGHRIKYGNLEAGNTTQQLLLATRPCCSSEFIESFFFFFFFWVFLATYNIRMYICIYIFKVSYIHYVLLFSMVWLHWMLNILRYENNFVKLMSQLLHSTIHQVMWYFWVFMANPFSLFWIIFFSRNLCFLWSSFLLLIAESISLDSSGKPTVGFFLKITSPSSIILSISLDELHSTD